MQTIEQIVEQVRKGGFDTDPFGFGISDLIHALPFESAKEFLKEEYQNDKKTMEEWTYLKTEEEVLKEIAEYVSFAQEKIDDRHGLSADRSCQHFIAWFWLIDEQFSDELKDAYNHNYAPYGQPVLDKVKKYLNDKKITY